MISNIGLEVGATSTGCANAVIAAALSLRASAAIR
jgi:hypothetical protein